ncbi:MAG TPA: energy-coupling factor transporter transmembrane component T [Sporolactobacillaceae bacterium]|nr:energy-coupling factor transporter transmembrane component T [Sporolactobacillaceae bacterium]
MALILLTLEQHPVFLTINSLFLAGYFILHERGKRQLRLGGMYVILPLFFFLLNPLFNHRGTHVLFYFGQKPIMLEAIFQGLMMGLTLLGLLLLMRLFNFLIPSDRFLYLFSRFFPQWALLTMLSLRFIPLFTRRLTEIELVQRAKGRSPMEGNLISRAKAAMPFVQILLSWSLEEALQTADSMAARGYGITKRSRYHPYLFRKKDALLLIVFGGLFVGNMFGWWLGDSVLAIAPVLESLVLAGREWAFLLLSALYFGLPLIIDGGERLRWVYLKQKI